MSRDTHVKLEPSSTPGQAVEKSHRDTEVIVAGATPLAEKRQSVNPYQVVDNLPRLSIGDSVGGYVIQSFIVIRDHHILYRAFHPTVRVPVVLKVVAASEPMLRQTLNRQLETEFNVLREFSHNNIPRLWDYLTHDENPVLVTEFIHGQSLADVLTNVQTLPPRKVLRIALEINEVLEVLTRRNIIHCDVKPGNIMLLSNGQAKLIDFGLAQERDEEAAGLPSAEIGDAMGTAAYMSPEQFGRRALDHRTDVYSLGVTMYECLTGRLPFDAPDRRRLALRHMREMPMIPHAMNPAVPRAISDFVMKLLGKKPEDRMADHADLRSEIKSLMVTAEMQRASLVMSHRTPSNGDPIASGM